MKANFLIYPDSFISIQNPNVVYELDVINNTIDRARKNGDDVFGNSDLAMIQYAPNKFIFQIAYMPDPSLEIPNMTHDDQLILISLMQNETPLASKDWYTFNLEMRTNPINNGLMGLTANNLPCLPELYVNNETKWNDFHINFFVANPPERQDFRISLEPYYPNLYFNHTTIMPGLNGLNTNYKLIMKTILYHLTALNNIYYPYFSKGNVSGDQACDYLEKQFKGKNIEIGASRDGNDKELNFKIKIKTKKADKETENEKTLYCDLHTKFWQYFEFQNPSHTVTSDRIYFHLPVKNFIENKLIIAKIGKHA